MISIQCLYLDWLSQFAFQQEKTYSAWTPHHLHYTIKNENCLSHINALTSAGIPSNMCASTNTNIDMNTKMELSVGVGVLFNTRNKKALVLCSLASNHFSWGNPEAEIQSLTIQATLKNKGLRSGVHRNVRYVPIALARFKQPLTRPACMNPPAFKILSFSASRSGLWSLDKLYACVKKSIVHWKIYIWLFSISPFVHLSR